MDNMQEKIKAFAALVEKQGISWHHVNGINYEGHHESKRATIKPGKKYVKVDVGDSGMFMIDSEGNIYGIKAYGVIHRGKHYGTLDTTDHYLWGDYSPIKKQGRYAMEELKCNKCGHTWNRRVDKPLQCPRCKQYGWDKPRSK